MSKSLLTLLAMARAKCTSDDDLARRIGTHAPNVSLMRNGGRPIGPETAALLCDVLELPGEEAREYVALAVIQGVKKDDTKRERVKRALFASWVLGVVGILSGTAPNDVHAQTVAQMRQSTGSLGSTERPGSYTLLTDVMHISMVCHVLAA